MKLSPPSTETVVPQDVVDGVLAAISRTLNEVIRTEGGVPVPCTREGFLFFVRSMCDDIEETKLSREPIWDAAVAMGAMSAAFIIANAAEEEDISISKELN